MDQTLVVLMVTLVIGTLYHLHITSQHNKKYNRVSKDNSDLHTQLLQEQSHNRTLITTRAEQNKEILSLKNRCQEILNSRVIIIRNSKLLDFDSVSAFEMYGIAGGDIGKYYIKKRAEQELTHGILEFIQKKITFQEEHNPAYFGTAITATLVLDHDVPKMSVKQTMELSNTYDVGEKI